MSDARSAGSLWTRCARRLGLDRNPLRRSADRLEVLLRLSVAILILTVPVAMVGVGRAVDHRVMRQAQVERATDRQVQAVLTEAAPAHGSPDPYSGVQAAWVPARWTAPSGAARTGQVLAVAGAKKGSTVSIWIDRTGAATDPPTTHGDVVSDVFIGSASTGLLLIMLLVALRVVGTYLLDRRRLRAWDAGWRAVGPLWTGHRSG